MRTIVLLVQLRLLRNGLLNRRHMSLLLYFLQHLLPQEFLLLWCHLWRRALLDLLLSELTHPWLTQRHLSRRCHSRWHDPGSRRARWRRAGLRHSGGQHPWLHLSHHRLHLLHHLLGLLVLFGRHGRHILLLVLSRPNTQLFR